MRVPTASSSDPPGPTPGVAGVGTVQEAAERPAGNGRWVLVAAIVRSLLPLAVVTTVLGVLTLYLLDASPAVGQWLLAVLLFAHGWVHVMFAFPRPRGSATATDAPAWPFDLGDSWLIARGGIAAGPVRAIGRVLVVVTLAGFLLAALSTVGILVPAAWWPALVLGSAASSAILLGLCFSPTLVLGLAIDVALAWLVLSGTWSPTSS